MVQDEMDGPLTKVLIDFASILGTDFAIQNILDHLVSRIVGIIPVTGAGVMLMSDNDDLHFLAASNATVRAIEVLQNELSEGPCLDAYRTGEPVAVPDLSVDKRFRKFSPRALHEGLAAVFTFPLRMDGHRLGALDLYRDTAGGLSDRELRVAQVLADVAAGYLANAQARLDAATSADHLRHQSLHDPLTGLPNRTLLVELLEIAVARTRRSHHVATVLFVDLDDFKSVNDRYGHHVGDQLLIAVAGRIRGLLRPGDTFSRVGGDEFVALCEDMNEASDAGTIAERITTALAAPFDLSEIRVSVTGSVGVAFSGSGQDIPELLLRNADFAMYQAKNSGGGRHHVSEPGSRLVADQRAALERDLRKAAGLDQLFLAYQPILSVSSGRLSGVEALLRWDHPKRGLVMPDVIIPYAERIGMMMPIGEWVLRQACRDLGQWSDGGFPIDSVAVNVSAQQVTAAGFAETIVKAVEETGVDPTCLCLEVTESLFLRDAERAIAVLKEVKDLGVRLSLDDFGTGYSSLSYLRHFPVDIVKIDRSFTANLTGDEATRSIVRAVIDLSHVLKLTVVAEGVETVEELDMVSELGADYVQGYHFSRPLAKNKLVELLAGEGASWMNSVRAAR